MPKYMFPWCEECHFVKDCYKTDAGLGLRGPFFLDPECTVGPGTEPKKQGW